MLRNKSRNIKSNNVYELESYDLIDFFLSRVKGFSSNKIKNFLRNYNIVRNMMKGIGRYTISYMLECEDIERISLV